MTVLALLRDLWNPVADLVRQAEASQEDFGRPDVFLDQLRFRFKQRVKTSASGDFRGVFKGHGMDLQNLREYQPGDEIRKIDWNVLARTGVPHIKEHYEERQLPVWFFVDASSSMRFGQRISKLDYAKQLVGLMGLMAVEAGHRVGLIVWTGKTTPLVLEPKPNRVHLQCVLQKIEEASQCVAGVRELSQHFPELASFFKYRSLVFLLSDYAFLEKIPDAMSKLSYLSPKHEVYSLLLVDPVEREFAFNRGKLPLMDAESQEVQWVNTSDRWMLRAYRQAFQQQVKQREECLRHWSKVREVSTNEDPLDTLFHWVSRYGH